MQSIAINRYGEQKPTRAWDGSIEPNDRSWILFVDTDNVPQLYLHRDISGDEAIERGMAPYDPATKKGVRGEYVTAANMPEGERPTSNLADR